MKTLFLLLFISLTSFIRADFLYTARDVGTLDRDKSEARSINENGWVVGKAFLNDRVSDFLWTPESGLQYLTHQADKEIFPKINNKGSVTGCIVNEGSWFSPTLLQTYIFKQNEKMKLTEWAYREDGIFFATSDTLLITSDHIDVFESTLNYLVFNNQVIEIKKYFPKTKVFPSAVNNHSQLLITEETPGFFGTSWLATYSFAIYDVAKDQRIILDENKLYYGLGLNDNNLVIARNKEGNEGFYGSKELGIKSLGTFIPSALNNRGDIVGKRGKEILLRTHEGKWIDLNRATDLKSRNIDRLLDVWAINTKGQIIVTAQMAGKTHPFLLEPSPGELP